MEGRGRPSKREALIREILAETASRAETPADRQSTSSKLENLVRRDYSRALRRAFDGREIGELIREARRIVWPKLNEEAVRIVPPDEFVRRWARVGVEFELASAPGDGNLLLGFYLRKYPGLKRPLICVSTAHPDAVVGATFAHEMGHHVTAEIFGPEGRPNLLIYTEFEEHLDDPPELAADILVSLGVYPNRIARTLAGGSGNKSRKPRDGGMKVTEAVEYFARHYNLSLDAGLSEEKRLLYLAGIIYFTQLRKALLDEYDV